MSHKLGEPTGEAPGCPAPALALPHSRASSPWSVESPLDTPVPDEARQPGFLFLFCVEWIRVGEDGGGCNILKSKGEPRENVRALTWGTSKQPSGLPALSQ